MNSEIIWYRQDLTLVEATRHQAILVGILITLYLEYMLGSYISAKQGKCDKLHFSKAKIFVVWVLNVSKMGLFTQWRIQQKTVCYILALMALWGPENTNFWNLFPKWNLLKTQPLLLPCKLTIHASCGHAPFTHVYYQWQTVTVSASAQPELLLAAFSDVFCEHGSL